MDIPRHRDHAQTGRPWSVPSRGVKGTILADEPGGLGGCFLGAGTGQPASIAWRPGLACWIAGAVVPASRAWR
jgi:hypothetical protein